MNEARPNRSRREQIDFPPFWFLTRGTQALIAVFFAKATYLARESGDFLPLLISTGGVVLLVSFSLRGIATGNVADFGMAYRVYFRQKKVPWEDVEAIEWLGYRLKVILKRAKKGKRVIVFLLNPFKSLGPYWAHRLGAEVLPPEILERIRDLPIETPPQITSAPPYSKWALRAGLAVVGFFVLLMLWRFLVAGPSSSR